MVDDETSNTIVVTEKYQIDEFWKEDKHELLAHVINDQVYKPDISQRTMPLSVTYPRSVHHRIELDLSEPYQVLSDNQFISDGVMNFQYVQSRDGNLITLDYVFNTSTDSVPVEKVARHLATRDRIRNFVGFELTRPRGNVRVLAGSRPTGFPAVAAGVFGLGVIVMLVAVVSVVLGIKLTRKPDRARHMETRRGSTPETAIPVHREDELDAKLASMKCDCGELLSASETASARERFKYDDRRLVGVRVQCKRCLRTHDVYLDLGSPGVDEFTTLQLD